MMISMLGGSAYAQSENLEVFTISTIPINLQGFKAHVCELDALKKLTYAFNQELFSKAKLQKENTKLKQLYDFYHCQQQASLYQLQFLPAIVVDKRVVVYGIRAMDKALILARHESEIKHA